MKVHCLVPSCTALFRGTGLLGSSLYCHVLWCIHCRISRHYWAQVGHQSMYWCVLVCTLTYCNIPVCTRTCKHIPVHTSTYSDFWHCNAYISSKWIHHSIWQYNEVPKSSVPLKKEVLGNTWRYKALYLHVLPYSGVHDVWVLPCTAMYGCIHLQDSKALLCRILE